MTLFKCNHHSTTFYCDDCSPPSTREEDIAAGRIPYDRTNRLDRIRSRLEMARAELRGPMQSMREGNSCVPDMERGGMRSCGQSRVRGLLQPFSIAALAVSTRSVHDVFLPDDVADFVAKAPEDIEWLLAQLELATRGKKETA